MKPGTKVGAGRWPYASAHPDCWGKPWAGRVLAVDNPRAWEGTFAFPKVPTQEETTAHVKRHCARLTSVPVLWDFGVDGQKIYWERPEALRSYADDLAAWFTARNEARGNVRLTG